MDDSIQNNSSLELHVPDEDMSFILSLSDKKLKECLVQINYLERTQKIEDRIKNGSDEELEEDPGVEIDAKTYGIIASCDKNNLLDEMENKIKKEIAVRNINGTKEKEIADTFDMSK